MKVGIMQPYFFPYIGYFQLINYVDQWVVFDDAQYIRHGWINRNRILHPAKEWSYIIVPLEKHSHKEDIRNICINSEVEWKKKIIGQLSVYAKKAPYYKEAVEVVKKSLDIETQSMTALNIHTMKTVCDYLEIPFSYVVSSECQFNYDNINHSGDWALEISRQLNAEEYINPINGRDLFDKRAFEAHNIKLSFLNPVKELLEYDQKSAGFEPFLSIIDVMMFNDKKTIQNMLNHYEVL